MEQTFTHNEIQESPFAEELRRSLSILLSNAFFSGLRTENISLEGYRFFIKEKYSATGYFVPLVTNAEQLTKEMSPQLSEVFKHNRFDETGVFAGQLNPAYSHETWKLNSLESFGISKDDLQGVQLESSKKHNEIMMSLARSTDMFEVVGALLFLELFIVYEMKNMIAAFERDLPELFPKDGYQYDRMPFNTQEYWYGHALHDTWHYRSIEEALLPLMTLTGFESAKESLFRGIEKVVEARGLLYNAELFEKMKSL